MFFLRKTEVTVSIRKEDLNMQKVANQTLFDRVKKMWMCKFFNLKSIFLSEKNICIEIVQGQKETVSCICSRQNMRWLSICCFLHLSMAKHDSVQTFDTADIFQATKTARHLFYIKKWNKISHFFLLLFSFQLAVFLFDCCSQNADVVKVCALHCLVLIESIQFEPFVSFDFDHLFFI